MIHSTCIGIAYGFDVLGLAIISDYEQFECKDTIAFGNKIAITTPRTREAKRTQEKKAGSNPLFFIYVGLFPLAFCEIAVSIVHMDGVNLSVFLVRRQIGVYFTDCQFCRISGCERMSGSYLLSCGIGNA